MSNKVWVLILSRLLLPELKGRRRGWWPYHTPESEDSEDTWGSFRDGRSPRGAQVGRRVAPQPGGSGWPMTRSFARVNTLPAGELTRLPLPPPPPCRRSRVQLWRGARRSREDTHARGSASPAQRVHQLAPTSRTHLAGALAHLPASRRRRAPRGDEGGEGVAHWSLRELAFGEGLGRVCPALGRRSCQSRRVARRVRAQRAPPSPRAGARVPKRRAGAGY